MSKKSEDLGQEYLENIFSRSLIKTTHQRKLRQIKCLIFQFLNQKILQNTNFAKLPMPNGFFWYNCKFHYSKIEK